MKVLMINSVCGIGSTGRICTDLADKLTEEGHLCKIAYGRYCAPEKYQKYAVRIGTEAGVRWNGAKARLFDNEGFNAKKATIKFLEWVKEFDPDIIHLHNLHGYYLNVELLFDYIKKSGKKVIWTLHDCWAFTGHCAYFTMSNCEKWEEKCDCCGSKGDYPKAYSDCSNKNYARKKAAFTGVKDMTIVTPSNWLADLVGQSFLKDYPVKVIKNGINLDIFQPIDSDFRARYHLEEKKVVLGVAAIWDKRKGFDDFLSLAKRADDSYRFVMLGVNKKQLKILPKNVIGIEHINCVEELAKIYTAADAFVNPTREDNYPTVNMESIACGTPVITFKTGGSPECIDETTGVVVDCGDIDAMQSEIERVCEEKPFSKAECIKRAQGFDKNVCFSDYLEMYKG